MSYTRASITTRSAPLFDEFGLSYATKLFGEEAIASLPRYVRGPKTGKIKAWLTWEKAESGGWDRRHGGVVYPGLVRAWIATVPYAHESSAIRGQWMGREQSLCGSKGVLTAEYRAQEVTRQFERAEELEQLKRSVLC